MSGGPGRVNRGAPRPVTLTVECPCGADVALEVTAASDGGVQEPVVEATCGECGLFHIVGDDVLQQLMDEHIADYHLHGEG